MRLRKNLYFAMLAGLFLSGEASALTLKLNLGEDAPKVLSDKEVAHSYPTRREGSIDLSHCFRQKPIEQNYNKGTNILTLSGITLDHLRYSGACNIEEGDGVLSFSADVTLIPWKTSKPGEEPRYTYTFEANIPLETFNDGNAVVELSVEEKKYQPPTKQKL